MAAQRSSARYLIVLAAARRTLRIPDGVNPKEHEIATALRLLAYGLDVSFRERSNVPGTKNPDAMIDGEVWEFKSPLGASEKNTISGQFKSAKDQAENLVIDLARCGLPDALAIDQATRRFLGQKRFARLIILDHDQRIIRLLRFPEGGNGEGG